MRKNTKDIHIRRKLGKLLRSRVIKLRIAKRRRWNNLLKITGCCSVILCLLFLVYIIFYIFNNCYYAFRKVEILVPLSITNNEIEDLEQVIGKGMSRILPDYKDYVVSTTSVWLLTELLANNKDVIGTDVELWLPASSKFSSIVKRNRSSVIKDKLRSLGRLRISFNDNLFLHSDSQHPEYAGILGAIFGSLLTISICCVCALPVGILTGIYLQEFKFKNKFISSFIEISINNLSATPAIIFGVVGLYFYINIFGVPRSSALVGGLVLSLMMLPILVISTRQALCTIPNSIKEAAYALGASRIQVVLHHSLPIAFPGILTGVILAIARIVAESAPLLMVGMGAFVGDVAGNILEPTTVFPLQIYLWSSNPDNAFAELNSVLMLVLLLILLTLNICATVIRRKMQFLRNN